MFPKLFPHCLGDPTIKARRQFVTETDAYRHLIKYACKLAYSNELYYPFAEHPRFMFYVNDRLIRHRSFTQSKIYLLQNLEDANMSALELKEHLQSNDC